MQLECSNNKIIYLFKNTKNIYHITYIIKILILCE